VVVVAVILSHRSTDSGVQTTGAFVGGDLHSLVVDPTDSHHLYVGGHESAAVSRDGGRTFRQIPGLQHTDAMASGHYGLRTSDDGGASWSDMTGSLPASDVHAVGLDPADPRHLWAYVASKGVYTSTDNGRQWELAGGASLSLMGAILVSPGGGELMAADMSNQSIVRSTDGGRNWAAGTSSMMAAWLARDPADAHHLLAAGNGISESLDGGESWRSLSSAPADVTAVAVAAGPKPMWYAAALEGDHALVYSSTDRGAHWEVGAPRS